ncbi:hypothetical protein ESY86_15825 [Subsaximicrobium wynnwilliamsii]|uniref:ParA family protein n=1 Tax=Subsaximicrobium wynnwilliamsii TaxID=291179 RepID=A0A5C6ZDI0_9FLAO|nr:hypothetical protein [Subsaximicrobium wynnwilliamsii]TXD82134.1 hypothetical protein ESY87_15415 [Subsaximicrobium wynnwilliamsii]TXD87779.1 hypothetical protein ESY86_15825 [Subsaximicrobium wynnwilliamsii]TXE01590.1 hypothetical protein ESY88_15405 [Subsaximicrobium wynnwilliamsii]
MKTIIAIKNSGNKGKTEIARKLANLLVEVHSDFKPIYPIPFNILKETDFSIVLKIDEKIVGIESQGDPGTNLKTRLETLILEYNCDLIICTCRSRGETVRSISAIANLHKFQTIWDSTYESKICHEEINKLKAEHLYDLMKKLKLT